MLLLLGSVVEGYGRHHVMSPCPLATLSGKIIVHQLSMTLLPGPTSTCPPLTASTAAVLGRMADLSRAMLEKCRSPGALELEKKYVFDRFFVSYGLCGVGLSPIFSRSLLPISMLTFVYILT